MIELRFVQYMHMGYELQYRYLPPCIDASGALCPGDKWTDWKRVDEVDDSNPSCPVIRHAAVPKKLALK